MTKDSTFVPIEKLRTLWLKAAVAGGLWASVEIIMGSFLHNLRVPFAGAVLASFGVMLMVAFYRMWPERGLIWRAGMVCALMKSISPSANLLGPMIGIFAESIVLNIGIIVMGRSIPALMVAGGFAVMVAFAQKLFNILIIYGLNLVKIYLNLLDYVARQLGYHAANPWALVIILFAVYFGLGFMAAFTGFLIGRRIKNVDTLSINTPTLDKGRQILHNISPNSYSLVLLFINILVIPAGIILVNRTHFWLSLGTIMIYVSFTLYYYPTLRRRLTKPILWIQLLILVLLSGLFFEHSSQTKTIISIPGLMAGIEMCFRAMLIISAFTAISFELRNPIVRNFLLRQGLSQLYQAVSLAFQAMPAMLEAAAKPSVFFKKPISSIAKILAMAGKWQLLMEKEKQGHPPHEL
ncbi:MAG: hypothetical protein U1C46_07095 [Bacteroidales bacterium]|nr:hypothetical protein [Bacteroidales bacterium]MDZ4204568.1 hypothetical protein [Bacteroidales bacterium]